MLKTWHTRTSFLSSSLTTHGPAATHKYPASERRSCGHLFFKPYICKVKIVAMYIYLFQMRYGSIELEQATRIRLHLPTFVSSWRQLFDWETALRFSSIYTVRIVKGLAILPWISVVFHWKLEIRDTVQVSSTHILSYRFAKYLNIRHDWLKARPRCTFPPTLLKLYQYIVS